MRVASAEELGRTGWAKLRKLAAVALVAVLLPMAGNSTAEAAPNPYPTGPGYWLAGADGGVFNYPTNGTGAQFRGSMGGQTLRAPIIDMAATPFWEGYWLLGLDGGVFSFGSAKFFGSQGGRRLVAPVLGIAAHPSGLGYWLVAADGGVFSHGAARFWGSMGGRRLNAPIVSMAATPSGLGYWLVASDGGVFAFGDASFKGSTGGFPIAQPIVGIESTPSGLGYWLFAIDGGVFAFGDAGYYGAPTELPAAQRPPVVVGMAHTNRGDGYWMVTPDGAIYTFGAAPYLGGANTNNPRIAAPILGIDARPPLSLVVDPFVDASPTCTSNWETKAGDEVLSLVRTSCPAPPGNVTGARVLGVEGLNASQLGMVGFTVSPITGDSACTAADTKMAIYADSNNDGNFDKTNNIGCAASPGTTSVNPTTGGSRPLAPTDVITAIDVYWSGGGTIDLDNISAAGVTVSSSKIHAFGGTPGTA